MFLGTLQACLTSGQIYKYRLIEMTRCSGFLSTIQQVTTPNPTHTEYATFYNTTADTCNSVVSRVLRDLSVVKYSVVPFLAVLTGNMTIAVQRGTVLSCSQCHLRMLHTCFRCCRLVETNESLLTGSHRLPCTYASAHWFCRHFVVPVHGF